MNNPKTDEALLIELNERIGEAEKARNDQFMQDILSDQLVFRRGNGERNDKTQYLAGLVDLTRTYQQLEVSNINVVKNPEDLALVSLIVKAAGMRGEEPFSGTYRNIRVFRKESSALYGWKCFLWFNEKIVS